MRFPFWPISVLALVCLASCARHESAIEAGRRTQTIYLNLGAEPRDFDPQTTSLSADGMVIHALMEGLAEMDPVDCHPVPGVAERWETSQDGLTWMFHLRPTARWSNGDEVTARDFVYAYRRTLLPALAAEYRDQFFCLKGAEEFAAGKLADFAQVGVHAIDDHTLVLELKNPVPYLPTLVAQPCWFPVHRATIEKFGRIDQRATAWTRPGNFVGNGAFVLKEWAQSRHVRVVKSETYWDREHVALREVVFHPIENSVVGEAAFRAGQLHVTTAPVDKLENYKKDPRLAPLVHEAPALETALFRLNCRRAPLDDVRVRRALSLAIDRNQLARGVVHSEQAAAFALTPPNCAGYTAERSVKTDVAEARRLLAEAGFAGGRNFPATEVLFYVFHGTEQPVAEALQQMWRVNLGITVSLVKQEMKTVVEARGHGTFQILIGSWIGDYLDPSTFLDLMRTGGRNNGTGWASAEYDGLLDEAARTIDPAARFAVLRRAEALMLGEAAMVPLFYQPIRTLRDPSVRGWHENLLDQHPLKGVSLEK